MKLWVIYYSIGDVKVFLKPDRRHTANIQDAIKFNKKESAINFLNSLNSFIKYSTSLEEIPDHKNNALLDY